jgi:Ca2+-binding RTX toxin-like protein
LRARTHAGVDPRPSSVPGAKSARRGLTALAAVLVLALLLPSAAVVFGKASHAGWPTNDCNWRKKHRPGPGCGVYRSHNKNQDGMIAGTDRSDELLGGHGNDTVEGGPDGDVIWGDFWPCCQPDAQRDALHGGFGNDVIYASHGSNEIDSGPGNDVVHAHFGRGGVVDCGSGYDVLFVSHRSKPRYSARNCERTRF